MKDDTGGLRSLESLRGLTDKRLRYSLSAVMRAGMAVGLAAILVGAGFSRPGLRTVLARSLAWVHVPRGLADAATNPASLFSLGIWALLLTPVVCLVVTLVVLVNGKDRRYASVAGLTLALVLGGMVFSATLFR